MPRLQPQTPELTLKSTKPLFQDVLTKKIFGRAAKIRGLYYVDDLDLGKVYFAQSSQRQGQDIWLWHCRLRHPSFSYL